MRISQSLSGDKSDPSPQETNNDRSLVNGYPSDLKRAKRKEKKGDISVTRIEIF